MVALIGFAFVSGLITILSPCILPVLPIVLAGGAGRGKLRPLGVVAGFIASFTFFTLTLTALVQALGISADVLRYVAVAVILAAGVVMLVPGLRDRFEVLASRLANRAPSARPGSTRSGGFLAGLPVGLGLGLLWTPCVGPIMASVISLALTQRVDGGAVTLTVAYTLGTAIPMLAVMIGGRALMQRVPGLARNAGRVQRVFGALMILVGVGVAFGVDRKVQAALLRRFPNYGAGLTALENTQAVRTALRERQGPPQVVAAGVFPGGGDANPEPMLKDYGKAPALVAGGPWIGSPALAMEDLRGKVVVLDFWTYSCVNCVRTVPYLQAWDKAYRDRGLVILGVHTPEFEFEKNPANVERAIRDLGVSWPVVLDNTWSQWRAYSNRYWPAKYLIDAQGQVRYYHFGEGDYEAIEMMIQSLLRESGANVGGFVSEPPPVFTARTPETYLGYLRTQGFVSLPVPQRDTYAVYTPQRAPANSEWTLEGSWKLAREYAVAESGGVLELGFNARNVFLVIEPERTDGTLGVELDGRVPPDTPDVVDGTLQPSTSRLYQIVGLRAPGEHRLRLRVDPGLRLFAFTFG